jgi:hypothetical protein
MASNRKVNIKVKIMRKETVVANLKKISQHLIESNEKSTKHFRQDGQPAAQKV